MLLFLNCSYIIPNKLRELFVKLCAASRITQTYLHTKFVFSRVCFKIYPESKSWILTCFTGIKAYTDGILPRYLIKFQIFTHSHSHTYFSFRCVQIEIRTWYSENQITIILITFGVCIHFFCCFPISG